MKTSLFVQDLECVEGISLHERLFLAFKAALGEQQIDTSDGSFVDLFAFAFTAALATASSVQDRAWAQRLSARTYDLLEQQESEWGLIPSPTDLIRDRRRALAAAKLIPKGATRINIENTLKALLGADFIGWAVTSPNGRITWPADLGDSPQSLVRPDVPRKLVRTGAPISTGLGAQVIVPYIPVSPLPDTGEIHTLAVNDHIVVEPENPARAEAVIIEGTGDDGHGTPQFMATLSHAHDDGCVVTTMPFPLWVTNQRHSLVVVSASAAANPEVTRKVGIALEKMMRGTSTWAIAAASGPHQTGPLLLGNPSLGLLGMIPLGLITVPTP